MRNLVSRRCWCSGNRWLNPTSFRFFKGDRSPYEVIRNHPYEWKEKNSQDKPGESESSNPCRHQFRSKVIQKWKAQQSDQKHGSASDGKVKLSLHQPVQERFAMNIPLIIFGVTHAEVLQSAGPRGNAFGLRRNKNFEQFNGLRGPTLAEYPIVNGRISSGGSSLSWLLSTFPVTHREFLGASRKPSTRWVRLAVTVICFLVCVGTLTSTGSSAGAGIGRTTFNVLTGLTFAYALLAGLWFTADCISLERREGTLPLLYLTRVGAIELVTGKLAACSLTATYGLIAVLPMIAIAILGGGITGVQMWRTSLMLLVTLMFSLSAGMFASTISTRQSTAYSICAALVIVPTVSGLFGTMFALLVIGTSRVQLTELPWRKYVPWLLGFLLLLGIQLWAVTAAGHVMVGSPAFAWQAASETSPGSALFNASLMGVFALGAFYFYSAALTNEWRIGVREMTAHETLDEDEEPLDPPMGLGQSVYRRDLQPLKWLLFRRSPGGVGVAAAAFITVLFTLLFRMAHQPGLFGVSAFWVINIIPAALLAFALARQASRVLGETARNGFLEVLLTLPGMSLKRLSSEQAEVTWKVVLPSVMIVLIVRIALSLPYMMAESPVPIGFTLFSIVMSSFVFLLFVQTVITFAISMAFSGRKALQAAGWTVLYVVIAPMLILSFAILPFVMLLVPRSGYMGMHASISLIQTISQVVIYFGLLKMARRRMNRVCPAP